MAMSQRGLKDRIVRSSIYPIRKKHRKLTKTEVTNFCYVSRKNRAQMAWPSHHPGPEEWQAERLLQSVRRPRTGARRPSQAQCVAHRRQRAIRCGAAASQFLCRKINLEKTDLKDARMTWRPYYQVEIQDIWKTSRTIGMLSDPVARRTMLSDISTGRLDAYIYRWKSLSSYGYAIRSRGRQK